jgi:hypothetical protein
LLLRIEENLEEEQQQRRVFSCLIMMKWLLPGLLMQRTHHG